MNPTAPDFVHEGADRERVVPIISAERLLAIFFAPLVRLASLPKLAREQKACEPLLARVEQLIDQVRFHKDALRASRYVMRVREKAGC